MKRNGIRKKEYKVLYNLDPTTLSTVPPTGHGYEKPITKDYVESFVTEIAHTQVDALCCCPTMLRRKLWDSQFDPHWSQEAPTLVEPPAGTEWEWDEKTYFRMRRYILSGGQPVKELYETAKREALDFFFSYRMNDCHFLAKSNSPILDTFWREHPELHINHYGGEHPNMDTELCNLLENYMFPEVRSHYASVLEELVQTYDVDGLELDLMRKPCFVPVDQLEEGTAIMTGFVRGIRDMLNRYGKQRDKYLQLCVRVPHDLATCLELAMDVETWDRENLIDMVNTSTSFLISMEALDVEGFRSKLKNARIYGEMHYALAYGKKWPNWGRHFVRNTTKEQYETTAYYLLGRGVDGVSLFNFVGSRQQEFYDRRSIVYPGKEPPLVALEHLGDREHLEKCPKHYYFNQFIVDGKAFHGGVLPAANHVVAPLKLFEQHITGTYRSAVLRFETADCNRHLPVSAKLNDVVLQEFEGTGELFSPVSIEGLPVLENVRYYHLPLELLKTGTNKIEIHNKQKTHPQETITFVGIELALYST